METEIYEAILGEEDCVDGRCKQRFSRRRLRYHLLVTLRCPTVATLIGQPCLVLLCLEAGIHAEAPGRAGITCMEARHYFTCKLLVLLVSQSLMTSTWTQKTFSSTFSKLSCAVGRQTCVLEQSVPKLAQAQRQAFETIWPYTYDVDR